MLNRSLYLKPGRDTSASKESVTAYKESIEGRNESLKSKTICVIGAGGNWAVGAYLLEAGAARVILQDPHAPERNLHALRQLSEELLEKYFHPLNGTLTPRSDRLFIERSPLEDYAVKYPASVDILCSNSVLEHVSDVEKLVSSMRSLLKPAGCMVHFIDLQDHYFRYPFEMLCYKSTTWSRWLNASNNLNRLRRQDYGAIFDRYFPAAKISTVLTLPQEFASAKPRIRSEFLTGDDLYDASAIIKIEA